jgi:hypothetical protein
VEWGVIFGIRARLIGCPMVPTGLSDSLRGVNCNISHRQAMT